MKRTTTKHSRRKLTLNTETLRPLDGRQLDRKDLDAVRGGNYRDFTVALSYLC